MREPGRGDAVSGLPPGKVVVGSNIGLWRFLVRFWPLLLFLGYLTFTVVIFALGPIPYSIPNPGATYGFIVAAHVALALGYSLVPYRVPEARPARADEWIFSAPNLIVVSAVLNILLLIPWTLYMTSGSIDVIGALLEPGAAYRRTYQRAIATTNPFTYAIMFVAPLMAMTVPLTLFYWGGLSRKIRAVAVAGVVAVLFPATVLGRNKGFADLFIFVVIFALVHLFRRGKPCNRRQLLVATSTGLIALLLFLSFFTVSIGSRRGRAASGYISTVGAYPDWDSLFLAPFPDELEPRAAHFYSYLSQGYYGLSYSLQVDFVWTRGFGSSFFLHMVQERFLGSEFARQNNYPARAEQAFGYSMLGHWHTVYPWIASDLTFPGTLIFVLVIGALLAATWFETLAGVNPFSVSMFANLCLMLFYFNANNQALAFPVQFSTTVGTLVLWLYTRWRLARAGGGSAPSRPIAHRATLTP